MRVLLDTCVLSELKNAAGSPSVQARVANFSDEQLFLSALTLGEIAKGISLLPAGKKKTALGSWLQGLKSDFSERIIPIDTDTAMVWGELTAHLQKKGVVIPAIDGLLAATALNHAMHLMTRNSRHFKATGATIIDPFV